MSNHTYRVIEIVGTSPDGIDAALRNGLARAAETTRGLDWFEVQSVRGHLENRAIAHRPHNNQSWDPAPSRPALKLHRPAPQTVQMRRSIRAATASSPALPPFQRPLYYIWLQPHNQIATA